MTSITVLEMRIRLERRFGCGLPATLAFEHPTAAAVVRHLATEVLGLDEEEEDAAEPAEPAGTAGTAGTAQSASPSPVPTTPTPTPTPTPPRNGDASRHAPSNDELLALLDDELAAADELINRTSP
jgi:hypothetical protein